MEGRRRRERWRGRGSRREEGGRGGRGGEGEVEGRETNNNFCLLQTAIEFATLQNV